MASHIRAKNRPNRPATSPAKERLDMRILVVEDQKSLALLMSNILNERWECEVAVAHTLAQVYAQLAKDADFGIAICDLNLPDAHHGEVIDVLGKAGIPAIAITGAFGEELRDIVLKKGVIDYVLKNSVNAYEYVASLVGRLHHNRKIKVLVVDDSISIRALLTHILTMLRFNVLTACNGKEALTILQQHPDIQLLLTDYNMPEMDGFALIGKVRRHFGKERLAIIGLSATENQKVSAQFLKYGANDFIHKPFSYEEILCRITQNVEMLELIEKVRDTANRDYLTGLHNRRYFFGTGGQIYHEALQKGTPLVTAMLDIDHFKHINDHYGHDCGDAALKHITLLINAHFATTLVARLGGEEFAILFQNMNKASARNQLEAFREALKCLPLVYNGINVAFTISIGFSDLMEGDLDDMLRIADQNLYTAKESGRDRVIGPS
ncbi:two-component system, cell cycle response regulator [Gammaproteobacteria bacterium]